MPELPDLVYLEGVLQPELTGKQIVGLDVKEPIIIRNLLGESLDLLKGKTFTDVRRHGPFLVFELSDDLRMIVHPMLAGAFTLEKRKGLVSIQMKDHALTYLDNKKMGKIYFLRKGSESQIPRFLEQGVNIRSVEFTEAKFLELINSSRRQVRAFLMEQESISAIGNAYADEILFDAGIHPKTFCYQLDQEQKEGLFRSINKVIQSGIDSVQGSKHLLHEKVRDHMLVRNRKNEPCPRCGSSIRRESVLGYDTFFCPKCQPAQRKTFIDWK
ncbi:MAG: DNA-formamidopyrimidine glycosylase [Spirochaetia bacterium]|nr:DNA-formamidopyrimidine glycosylase [Spirochaetia bacterium]